MIPVHLSPFYAWSRNKHTLLHRTFTVRVMWNLAERDDYECFFLLLMKSVERQKVRAED